MLNKNGKETLLKTMVKQMLSLKKIVNLILVNIIRIGEGTP